MWKVWDYKDKKVLCEAKTLDEAERLFNELAKLDPSLLEDERIEFQG